MNEQPTAPRRRRTEWLAPVAAVIAIVLVVAAAGAYFLYGKAASPRQAALASSSLQVCGMIPEAESERLVPGGPAVGVSRENDNVVSFACDWLNNRISHGEYWRTREISVRVEQHRGEGARTGRALAENSFSIDYATSRLAQIAPPDPGEKVYNSPIKDLPGIGDDAFAQYTWTRAGTTLWNSHGTGLARVDDMVIEVTFRASQKRKDNKFMTTDTTQSITEGNAIREVTGLLTHLAKGVAGWKAAHPGQLARTAAPVSPSASPTPSPSGTPLQALPPACQDLGDAVAVLVPDATTKAKTTGRGYDCTWRNLNIPDGQGHKRIRSVQVTVERFTDRAGGADVNAAIGYYTEQKGSAVHQEDFEPGGISWDKVKLIGKAGFSQHITFRTGAVHSGNTLLVLRRGATVLTIMYAGGRMPANSPTNGPDVKQMDAPEADAGALLVAKALLKALSS